MQLRDSFAEWEECEDTHLEMLQTERYSDDGDAECDSQADVCKGDLDSSDQYPDDIHDDGQTSGVIRTGGDVVAERPECQTCHLEQLHSERYSDDGDAEHQTYDCIVQADEEASEYSPDYVAYEFHFLKVSVVIPMSTQCRPWYP